MSLHDLSGARNACAQYVVIHKAALDFTLPLDVLGVFKRIVDLQASGGHIPLSLVGAADALGVSVRQYHRATKILLAKGYLVTTQPTKQEG